MVLEVGDDDLVALVDVLPAPALGDEVDALGRAADEHDVVRRVRTDEPRHGGAGLLVGVGGPGGQVVRGPVDVGVLVLVEVRQPIDQRARLLRGGGVVEPGDLPSVDALRQDREVRPDRGDVEDRSDVRCRPPVDGQEVPVAVVGGAGFGGQLVR